MTNLLELGFTDEEVEKIRLIAKIFKAQKVVVYDLPKPS
jgi:hypothetical protein